LFSHNYELGIFAFVKKFENGVSKRPLDVFERAEKMVVAAGDFNTAVFWYFDCFKQWQRDCPVYLYHILI
jgi:hypothetical protein